MITISQGDTGTLSFTAETGTGTPINLTGATFVSYVKGPAGAVVTIPNVQHIANPDQNTNTGKFTVSLLAADTLAMAEGTDKEWVTKITIGATTISYRGVGVLTVYQAAPIT